MEKVAGKGGSGGNAARKARRSLENPEEKAARLSAGRAMAGGDMSTQAATHRLNEVVFGVDPANEELMVEMEWEIENFLDAVQRASVLAVDQGKVLSVQIQFSQPDLTQINQECGGTKWHIVLTDFAKICALSQVCQIRLTQFDSVSAADAHRLETHAQRYLIELASDDPCGFLCQFYGVTSVSPLGLSVFNNGVILEGSPRALVVTLTMFTGDPKGTAEPSKARTDSVFGPTPTAVCFVVCNCIHGCDVCGVTFVVCEHPGTDKTCCSHASDGDPSSE